MKEWTGKILAYLWLAMISYGTFPLGTSLASVAEFFFGVLVLLLMGFRKACWPMWKSLLLVLCACVLGVLVRYLVEYGEAWWGLHFTAKSVARHLSVAIVCGAMACGIAGTE